MTNPASNHKQTTRVRRLPADVRIQQLLDSALIEFSAKGYTATRVDDIAKRAKLSKGGFYTHFKSKEQIFETLLVKKLRPINLDVELILLKSNTASELAEQLVNELYKSITDKSRMAIIRLLISESERVPHIIKKWKVDYLDQVTKSIETLLNGCIEKGIFKENIFSRSPWLILSPVVHTVIMQLILGSKADNSIDESRRDHKVLIIHILSESV
ncbi:TetR/AcrR family transcriptional regulator [Thiomicrorhabdus lithotrophica]|jgi:AcrR family transcriptional regulator|uniref:TetR/AcrR family transcriptional regulator n=1 Tax=Thiomicrorhabdus lithotrophica TaxID=2949997 RepID=A0ABY8CDQ0_9GAMM|nr:TetR/AcrR family transcriptional regulator [Thiomicrorhabdus lithotrophica]WEJ62641.1 TetR/AcrR family transcriptional regulator [Thiomicrorhabdus lithotrophica]